MSNELAVITNELRSMEPDFRSVLPANVQPERFMAVATTAIEQDPDLLLADRHSLFLACKRAAQDGLLPDKRQGALVVFNERQKDGGYKKKVQWMIMRQGLIDKAAKYGINIDSQPVYEKDEFAYMLGDNPRIEHSPYLKGARGDLIGAYAIATLKDGTKRREFMRRDEIEQARESSRSKDGGPWVKWYSEMARKTVIKRLFKSLPIVDMPDADRDAFFKDEDVIEAETTTPVEHLKDTLKKRLGVSDPPQVGDLTPIVNDLEDAASESLERLEEAWNALTKEQRNQLGKAELKRLKGVAEACKKAKPPAEQTTAEWLEGYES